jgi:type IV pilus assembly protein PilW
MVAMVVGVIIIGGAISLNSSTQKLQKVSVMQMDMVADSRFAIDMIAYDLRHAGMWGGTNKDGLIACKSSDTACTATAGGDTPAPLTIGGDCVPGWYSNLIVPVFATNNSNPYSTCIPTTENYQANTDVLEIRYADSNVTPSAELNAGQVYVRSNFVNGRVFIDGTAPEIDAFDDAPLTQNHELHAYAYYISDFSDKTGDNVPSLRRASLENGPTVVNQILVSGVVNLQVQFGEDMDDDDNQTVDRYVNPNAVVDWTKVYAAKVWLVMRSNKKQEGIDTSKTFSIAGADVSYGGVDDYQHFMVTSVINLRNLRQL